MEFGRWLISAAGLPVLVALIGLVAGLAGGVASQLVAGYFKSRGDTRQLSAGRELAAEADKRWRSEQEFERAKVYLSDLRAACTTFLGEVVALRWDYGGHVYETDGLSAEDYSAKVERRVDAVIQAEQILLLLAPSLEGPVEATRSALSDVGAGIAFRDVDEWHSAFDSFDRELRKLRSEMRKAMGLTDPPTAKATD